jgi:tetratricopeptide (TPR) repeat protein
MRRKILLTLFWLASATAFAAAGRLHGTVKDGNGNPIDKVTITIQSQGEINQTYTAHTNAKGEYIHIGVAPGLYRVTPSKDGYKTVDYSYADVSVTLDDRGSTADFKMQQIGTTGEMKPTDNASQEPVGMKEAKSGLSLLQEGKTDEAIQAFEKAVALDSSNATIHYNLGAAYERKDLSDKAQAQFEEAIKLKPDFGEAYLALGNMYLSQRKFDAPAIEALSKAAELLQNNYDAFYNLGVCYSNAGKYKEAEDSYRKAVAINPAEPIAHYQLAMALLGQSKNQEAKAEFAKYLELNPNAADKQEVQELMNSL